MTALFSISDCYRISGTRPILIMWSPSPAITARTRRVLGVEAAIG